MLVHASCVAVAGKAVLITGAAGAGKSDLALRLIDRGAALVADDQTLLTRANEILVASAPAAIHGLIEARHAGLLRMPCAASAALRLVVELAGFDENLERLPGDDAVTLDGVRVPRLRLPAFAASTPAKIRAVLNYEREPEA